MTSQAGSRSLADVYRYALRKLKEFDESTFLALTPEFKQLHRETLEALVKAGELIEKSDIFSTDEVMDDVKTTELQYFNFNFYLARVIERAPINSQKSTPDTRAAVLHLAARKYLEFSSLLEDYGNAAPNERYDVLLHKLLPQGVKGRFNLSAISGSKERMTRDTKIAALKAEMALENEYRQCRENFEQSHGLDEEIWRTYEIQRFTLHKTKAYDSIMSIFDELILLSSFSKEYSIGPLHEHEMPFLPTSQVIPWLEQKTQVSPLDSTFEDVRMANKNDQLSDRLNSTRIDMDQNGRNMFGQQGNGRLTGPKGEVRQPFVILPAGTKQGSSRAEAMANVFGTGQRSPTMSLDELVEKELANSLGPSSSNIAQEIDQDSDAAADAETMKARQWDDFTESVTKGSGNTLNLG